MMNATDSLLKRTTYVNLQTEPPTPAPPSQPVPQPIPPPPAITPDIEKRDVPPDQITTGKQTPELQAQPLLQANSK